MEEFEVEFVCYEFVSWGLILLINEGNGNFVIFYSIRVNKLIINKDCKSWKLL